MCACSCGASLLGLVASFLFVACLGAIMLERSHLRDVGLLAACLSPLCLALQVRVSHVSLVCAL